MRHYKGFEIFREIFIAILIVPFSDTVIMILIMAFLVLSGNRCSGFDFFQGFSYYASSIYRGISRSACSFRECCNENWNEARIDNLNFILNTKVFGQHLAVESVVAAIRQHIKDPDSNSKALALSFHGWTGSGKNYMVKFIVENLFSLGMKSKFFHMFVGKLHFPIDREVEIYKMQLQSWITGNVSNCETSLFVFDEVDRMPAGLLDALKPFIDHHEFITGVNYRKCIFIFLSNTGSNVIVDKTLEYWKSGRRREDLRLHDFDRFISRDSFMDNGGFLKSDTIGFSLIDYYIPFLPLEEEHVKQCIVHEFSLQKQYSVSQDVVRNIISELNFGPPPEQKYSVFGCKWIKQKVTLAIAEKRRKTEF